MMPKLICIMRVKDGMEFIHRWLENIAPLVDEIVLVDNGSTDGTLEVIKNHPKVVSIDQTEGYHEGRDKAILYNRARERNADWLLTLDVDEIFEKRMTRERIERMMSSKIFKKYTFRRLHLFKDENHFKAGLHNLFHNSVPDRMMWKDQPSGHFPPLKLHIGTPRGIKGLSYWTNIRIKHYSPLYQTKHLEKTKYYSEMDPGRAKMYEKHHKEMVKTWPFYEFEERPFLVFLQNSIYMFFIPLRVLYRQYQKQTGKIKNYPNKDRKEGELKGYDLS
jgi:glycosyltransferase involved in cell wall biosynthesis